MSVSTTGDCGENRFYERYTHNVFVVVVLVVGVHMAFGELLTICVVEWRRYQGLHAVHTAECVKAG